MLPLPPSAASLWFAQWDAQLAPQPPPVQVASVDSRSQEAAVSFAIKTVSPVQLPIVTNAFPACPAKTFILVFAFLALTPTAPTVKATINFVRNANQDTLPIPMEPVLPAPLIASLATPLEPDTATSVDAVRASPESDWTNAVNAYWDALHAFQLISASAWPAPLEHTQQVPVSASFAQLAAPPAVEQPRALAVSLATNFQEAAA
jgi:hypothetical protein